MLLLEAKRRRRGGKTTNHCGSSRRDSNRLVMVMHHLLLLLDVVRVVVVVVMVRAERRQRGCSGQVWAGWIALLRLLLTRSRIGRALTERVARCGSRSGGSRGHGGHLSESGTEFLAEVGVLGLEFGETLPLALARETSELSLAREALAFEVCVRLSRGRRGRRASGGGARGRAVASRHVAVAAVRVGVRGSSCGGSRDSSSSSGRCGSGSTLFLSTAIATSGRATALARAHVSVCELLAAERLLLRAGRVQRRRRRWR